MSMGGGGGDGTDTLGLFKAAKQSMVGLDACTDGFWVHFELPQEGVTETFPIYVVSLVVLRLIVRGGIPDT